MLLRRRHSTAVAVLHRARLLSISSGDVALLWPCALARSASPSTNPATLPTTAPVVQARETLLYAIPAGGRVADLVSSPDARHMACVLMRDVPDAKDRRFSVVVDGVVGTEHEWV